MPERKEFAQRVRQQLEDWDYQLDRLSARLVDLSHEWRQQARQRLITIRNRRDQLETELTELENHSGDAWQDIKAGIELAWDGLKTGLLAARSEFENNPSHNDKHNH